MAIPDDPQYTNHLGTVHSSALLALAEAGAGAFLAGQFAPLAGAIPVVRKLEAKFRKPASGRVAARCKVASELVERWYTELTSRGRVSTPIPVEIVDAAGTVVMSALVELFISCDLSKA